MFFEKTFATYFAKAFANACEFFANAFAKACGNLRKLAKLFLKLAKAIAKAFASAW